MSSPQPRAERGICAAAAGFPLSTAAGVHTKGTAFVGWSCGTGSEGTLHISRSADCTRLRCPSHCDTSSATTASPSRIMLVQMAASRPCSRSSDVVNEQRHGLGAPGQTAGEQHRRAELAQRARPAQRQSRRQRRPGERQRDAAEQDESACAVDPRRVFNLARHVLKADLRRANVKWRGHKRLGDDDGQHGEGNLDAQPVERRAEQSIAPGHQQERQPGHDRRQHDGQLDEHDQCPAERKSPPGEDVGQRRAEQYRERRGERAGEQAERDGLAHAEIRRRDGPHSRFDAAPDQYQDRHDQECQRQRRR